MQEALKTGAAATVTSLGSGLRSSEIAPVQVGGCLHGYHKASLLVGQGKGGKAREVFIPQELKTHLKGFLTWKRAKGEDVSDGASVSRVSGAPSPGMGSGGRSTAPWKLWG